MENLEKNKALVHRFNKEFIEEDKKEVFDEIVDPQLIYHAHPQGIEEGKEAFLNFFEQLLKPTLENLKVEIKDIIAEDDKVVTMKSYRGKLKEQREDADDSDDMVEIVVIEIIHFKNGKFIEYWNLMDSQDEGVHAIMEGNYVF